MLSAEQVLLPPDQEVLDRLCAHVAPGSRVLRVRRLHGGLDAGMHAIDLQTASGERARLVLRRYSPRQLRSHPEVPERAWRTLTAVSALALAAPAPLLFDAEGELFQTPAIVMSRLPGRGLLRPRDAVDWLRQLAAALAAIHRAPIAGHDLSFLPRPGEAQTERMRRIARLGGDFDAHPDGARVRAALEAWQPRLRRTAPVLVHGDFWAGNTLWLRDRLSGVVDWDSAALDAPGLDVGYCRADLSMLAGPWAPDIFLDAYQVAAGRRVPQLFYWDLLGAAVAMPDPERWLPGLHDLGHTTLTPPLMHERLRLFIGRALAGAE